MQCRSFGTGQVTGRLVGFEGKCFERKGFWVDHGKKSSDKPVPEGSSTGLQPAGRGLAGSAFDPFPYHDAWTFRRRLCLCLTILTHPSRQPLLNRLQDFVRGLDS